METRLMQFARALRAAGVPVSMAETVDAAGALTALGIKDREPFRISLRSTLIKRTIHLPVFDELFPIFFDGKAELPPDMDNALENLSEEEAEQLALALSQLKDNIADALRRLLRGEPLTRQDLNQLAAMTGLDRARNMRWSEWMVRRMQAALKHDSVRRAMAEIAQLLEQVGFSKERLDELRAMLQANIEAETGQLQNFAGQRITDNMQARPPSEDVEDLLHAPFGRLGEDEMNVLRQEVRRLSAALRSRISLRQKRQKTGTLDLKSTIRRNLGHGGVPFTLSYKRRQKKPRLVVICDVSTSMRYCTELMLSLIHAMQDQISRTYAFAFNDHLEYITPDLAHGSAQEAVDRVLVRMPPGHYSTDLGGSLAEFDREWLDLVNHRTTLLMVGDGRNNFRDPETGIFQEMARRCTRTIWLNPEPPMLWGTGDSDMNEYLPFCDHVLQVQTMAELTAAVDELLTR